MDLKGMFGTRYRLSLDASFDAEQDTNERREKWRYWEIRGKRGYVYPYGWNRPAVTFTRNRIGLKLARFRGAKWVRVQNGTDESTYLIPMDDLEFAIRSIKPRRKAILSEAEIARRTSLVAKHRFKPRVAPKNAPLSSNFGPKLAGQEEL